MKTDVNLFKVTKWLMIVGGTWRLKLAGVPKTWQTIYNVYSVVIQIVYYPCLVSFIIKFYELWGVDNDKAIECLSMLTIIFLLAIKTLLCQSKQMTTLLRRTIDDVNINALENDNYIKSLLTSHSRYSNTLNLLITIYSFSCGLHLNIMGFIEYYHFNENNPNITEILDKPLRVLYWYPFDPNEYYGVVIFYQLATILWSDLYNSASQALFNTIMIELSVQLKIMQHHFRSFTINIATGKLVSTEMATKRIKVLANKHQELIMFIKELNEALKYSILIEYVVSSLMLASILVQILSNKKVLFNAQYFLILAFQWFILSWNANEIIEQSQRLPFALFESAWYEQNKETKQIIFIMVLQSRKPLSLQIGPFGPLTNDAALSRLKLAYSYVSLISGNDV